MTRYAMTETTKHTPGPWEAKLWQNGQYNIVCNGGHTLLVYSQYGAIGYGDGSTNEADARLIAAAPELLEALEYAYEELRVAGNHAAADDCAAAIKKARGER